MMMREIVVKIGLLSATLIVAGGLVLTTTSHAESKDSVFGKDYDHDFEPAGGDPSKGPGFLDNATVRLGNTVIRTGEGGGASSAASTRGNSDRERAARQLRNRSVDSGTPR